jgi:hypothetical protein
MGSHARMLQDREVFAYFRAVDYLADRSAVETARIR